LKMVVVARIDLEITIVVGETFQLLM